MKLKTILLASIAITWMVACQSNQVPRGLIFNPDALPTYKFTVQTDKDTTISTPSGLEFNIPKDAIAVPTGNTVELEVQEALNMDDIVKAGLTTMADDQPLESDGMFSFNTSTEGARVVKTIKIRQPSEDPKNDMDVYKGELDADGNMNWVDPSPIDPEQERIKYGKQLFTENCASCHNIENLDEPISESVPSLAFISEKRARCWLYDFTRHNDYLYGGSEFLDVMECQAGEIYHSSETHWHTSSSDSSSNSNSHKSEFEDCPMFPEWSNEDIDALYDFIEKESEKQAGRKSSYTPPYDMDACAKACRKKLKRLERLNNKKNNLDEKLESEWANVYQGPQIRVDRTPTPNITNTPSDITPSPVIISPSKKITKQSRKASYYSFDIEAFGWYNVDKLYHDSGLTTANLLVKLEGEFKDFVDVFLTIPNEKIFARGGRSNQGDAFAFDDKNGDIPLPMDEPAWIYVMGEEKGQIYYDIVPFITQEKQTLILTPREGAKKDLDEALAMMSSEFTLKSEETGLEAYEELAAKTEVKKLK